MLTYGLPHECERENVTDAMLALDAGQRSIVRSYVRNVLYGEMTLESWCRSGTVMRVSLAEWRRPAQMQGGRYWGTEHDPNVPFRRAVQMYEQAWERWMSDEEERSVRRAGSTIRLKANEMARGLVTLTESANEQIRLAAITNGLKLAGVGSREIGSTVTAGEVVILPDNGRNDRT